MSAPELFSPPLGHLRRSFTQFTKQAITRFAGALAFAAAALTLSGAADANFGNGTGRVIIPGTGQGTSVVVQPNDGKILVSGPCSAPTSAYCVHRLNPDGSPDTSFTFPGNSSPGRIVLTALVPRFNSTTGKVIVRDDGKIIFGGTCNSGGTSSTPDRFCLARLLPNGAIDTTFVGPNATPGNGQFLLPVSLSTGTLNDQLRGLTSYVDSITSQRKIVAVGMCGFYHCIARVNEDGTYDTTFGGMGGAAEAPGSEPSPSPGRDVFKHLASFSETGEANAVVVEPVNNKTIIAGSCSGLGGSYRICLTKLNRDGTFDTGFRGTGSPLSDGGRVIVTSIASNNFNRYDERGLDIALQPNGDFVVLCGGFYESTISERHCVYRFNSGGTLDSNFSSGLPFPAQPNRTVWGQSGTTIAMAMANAPASTATANRIVSLGNCSNGNEVGLCLGVLQNQSGGSSDGVTDPRIIGPNADVSRSLQNNGYFRHPAWPQGGPTTGVGARSVAVNDAGEMFVSSTCSGEMCVYKFLFDGTLATGSCIADFNGDGNRSAPQDAYGVVRAMRGVTSPGLPAGLGYDIDGNGVIEPAIDGLLFARRMMGFSGAALLQNITFSSSASRTNADHIATYLDKRCGINP